MFLNLLFTPKGEENAIICRKSHFSPLSPACAHLLIIFKCNHLPFCFQNHWDFTPFRAELGGKGLALNISQCLKVWNVITRQMKDCVSSCCHVGCGELSTSMDCLFLCWGYKASLAGGLSVSCHPHTLAVTNRCVTSIGGFNDDWNGGDEGKCGILYKPHPLWHLNEATVTREWGHCVLHKLLFSSNWFHIFSFTVWFLT